MIPVARQELGARQPLHKIYLVLGCVLVPGGRVVSGVWSGYQARDVGGTYTLSKRVGASSPTRRGDPPEGCCVEGNPGQAHVW